jgi:predicted ATP-grasp superfamily ATP-dependent carboligase
MKIITSKTNPKIICENSEIYLTQGIDLNELHNYDIVFPFQRGKKLKTISKIGKYPFVISEKNFKILKNKENFQNKMIEFGFEKYIPLPIFGQFPKIIKPKIGVKSNKVDIILSPKIISDDYMIQDYLEGDEYSTFILAKDGQILFYQSLLYEMKLGQIRSDHYNLDVGVEVKTEFIQIFSDILEKFDFSGVCTIQYKIKNGIPKIFEINYFLSPHGYKYVKNMIKSIYLFERGKKIK